MAYDYDDEDDDPRTAEEMLETVRRSLKSLEERVKKVSEDLDDTTASLRKEIVQSRHEAAEMRGIVARMQSRMDNQLWTLVMANLASGVGVAALVLGAVKAFG
jgi:hypothetical protein